MTTDAVSVGGGRENAFTIGLPEVRPVLPCTNAALVLKGGLAMAPPTRGILAIDLPLPRGLLASPSLVPV